MLTWARAVEHFVLDEHDQRVPVDLAVDLG